MAWLWPAIGGGFGLVIGSFLALVTQRWPQGLAITGRSCCDACGAQLGVAELVPLLSWLALRGRCRRCGAAIASRHLAIELVAGLIGAALFWRHPPLAAAAAAVAGWWLLALIVLDVEHHWLPDALTLPLVPGGLLLGHGAGMAPVPEQLIGAVAGFAVLAALRLGYRRWRGREGMGGGDPKLLAGIGALLGWLALPFLLTAAAALGLALALADRVQGRAVSATTRLPLGALMAGVAVIALVLGPAWLEMLR